MALISSFTSRRLADRKPPATKQIITFKIGQEWLAVSTDIAQKVAPIQAIYKDQESLYLPNAYEGKDLHFFNLENYLTEGQSDQELDMKKAYLILFETPQKTLIAIPIHVAPVLRRISESAFVPISLLRALPKNIRTISRFAIRIEDEPLIFLLDYEYLTQIATV
jgi:chemotaxis signal transduction protein